MTVRATAEYVDLLVQFPPVPIHDNGQLERTEERIGELLALRERTVAQDAYLELLSDTVATWEDANVHIPRVSGRVLLASLIEERGLRQKDLVPVFGQESIVSEVLSGKRALRAEHIESLAGFFQISPSAFYPLEGTATEAGAKAPR